MPERIIVNPDLRACAAEHRRIRLSHLVGDEKRVRVTNPLRGGIWEGVIFGLADHPTMLIRLDSGQVTALPQHFAVEEIEAVPEPEPEPAQSSPVGMTRYQFLEVLDDIRARVASGDSFEGHLEYLMPEDPAPGVEFDVRAGYRIGNSMGQGGFRLIEKRDEEASDG